MSCAFRIASTCGRQPCTTTSLMPRLCSRFKSWTMPRNESSATTSPPNAMTNALPRNACTYGAAARIQCTNARIVAEFAGGVASGGRGIGSESRSAAGLYSSRVGYHARFDVRIMAQPLLDRLNPEQLAAVTLPHASALILAGAGSGKTRVLTTRIAWLLATGQAGPLSILAVTFTNKAAREMLLRLSALTPMNTRGMWVGTFHGLCNRMLRAHHREARLPQLFQILDTQDQLSLIKRMYRTHSIDD